MREILPAPPLPNPHRRRRIFHRSPPVHGSRMRCRIGPPRARTGVRSRSPPWPVPPSMCRHRAWLPVSRRQGRAQSEHAPPAGAAERQARHDALQTRQRRYRRRMSGRCDPFIANVRQDMTKMHEARRQFGGERINEAPHTTLKAMRSFVNILSIDPLRYFFRIVQMEH